MRSISGIFRSYGVLDEQGRHVNGTDKETNHRYGTAYESLFSQAAANPEHYRNRKQVELMMEVGVADGSSILAWREVFPNALCVGMDIHMASKLHDYDLDRGSGSRVEFYIGNQRNKEDCERVAGRRQFDFIVEDATHKLENTLLTFLYLWPFVRPGGLYVVEEWDNVGALRGNIEALWPHAEIVDTQGPFGGIESLVVFRKPL